MTCFGFCFGFSDDPLENSKNQRLGFFANLYSKIMALFRDPKPLDTEVPKSNEEVIPKSDEEVIPKAVESDFDPEYDNTCPTCFEEYTSENPKVTAKCNHHYHLGCIYEWMERSPLCPSCDREMVFEEFK